MLKFIKHKSKSAFFLKKLTSVLLKVAILICYF